MKRTIFTVLVVVTVGAVSCGRGIKILTALEIDSWTSIDTSSSSGLNKNPSYIASPPQLAALGSKLYGGWSESLGTGQIRVSVYNGADSAPAWTFIDGNGVNGLNHNSANNASGLNLTAFQSKLYALWNETAGVPQIRGVVYGGDDSAPSWSFIDGNGPNGLNKNNAQSATTPAIWVLGSKLYAAWQESNGATTQIRVVVYSGNDASPVWTFVDGNGANGINKNTGQSASVVRLIVLNSKLYATWAESNGTNTQIRIAVYNGNDSAPTWAFMDGGGTNGINKDTGRSAQSPKATVFQSKLYLTWYEPNSSSISQIRVAVYNGDDTNPSWSFVDGNGTNGLNKDSTKSALTPQLVTANSKLYLTWQESAGVVDQVRTAVYNGNDTAPSWAFVDGGGTNGLNRDTTAAAQSPLAFTLSSKVYLAWREAGKIRASLAYCGGSTALCTFTQNW